MSVDVARTGLHLFAPPNARGRTLRLPLGAPVCWTHRAAVARWKGNEHEYQRGAGVWRLTEGAGRYELPRIGPPREGDSDAMNDWLQGAEDPWYTRRPRNGLNKTILVWPSDGSGVLVGLVRRAIGESVANPPRRSGGYSMFDDPPDPGYFAAEAHVYLYAVKTFLQGMDYMLAPTWAVAVRPTEVS